MVENIILKRVGANTLTPLVTRYGSDDSPLSIIRVSMPNYWDEFIRATRFCHDLQRPSQLTVSNAFVRSMKVMYSWEFCSRHFSCSWWAANTMFIVFPEATLTNQKCLGASRWCLRICSIDLGFCRTNKICSTLQMDFSEQLFALDWTYIVPSKGSKERGNITVEVSETPFLLSGDINTWIKGVWLWS